MWTPATRAQHSRAGLRYGSDLTDSEWAVIEPLLPKARKTGRPWAHGLRDVMEAIFYVMRAGCSWRMLPDCFPPWQTVYGWFLRLRDGRVREGLNHTLVMADRERVGRQASPSAAIVDSQSVKTMESAGPRGYDAGKKIKGLGNARHWSKPLPMKRHALVDTDGRLLTGLVHEAGIQDRDGAGPLIAASRKRFPFVEKVFADAGYSPDRVAHIRTVTMEIVRRQPDQVGFKVLPRRWVVERFFAWINRNRRLAKDFETTIKSATAFLYAAAIMLPLRRLGRKT